MGKVILVTGISSGFGKHTAELLALRGYNVYGTIRKEAETDPKIKVLRMDLTDVTSIKSAVGSMFLKEGKIDVLINNAGMHLGGPIEFTPPEDFERQMATNFLGVVHLIQAVLPIMRKQGYGTIINISSVGGLLGLPFQGFYCSSKFALEGLSESLRMELKAFNIKVIVINPGDFNTNNTVNRKNIFNSNNENPYLDQFRKTLSIIEKDETKGWKPEILASKLCKIIECRNPKDRYIIGSLDAKFAVQLKKILPASLFSKLLGSFYGIK
jgi:NAD(P)-dependent dehydrogenase (short-subunit alcohol dehydrogenase family)